MGGPDGETFIKVNVFTMPDQHFIVFDYEKTTFRSFII